MSRPPKPTPLVSIITPFKNSEHYILYFYRHLCLQTYRNWRCFLIDDNSVDGGPALARSLSLSDPRVICLSVSPALASQHGPSAARNLGISHSKSPLIAFLDIDDIWHPHKLALQVDALTSFDADLVVSAYAKVTAIASHDLSLASIKIPPERVSLRKLLIRNHIPLLTVLVRRDILTHPFRPVLHEDYLYWLSLLFSNHSLKIHVLPCVLAFYRIHNQNLTTSRWSMPFWFYQSRSKSPFPIRPIQVPHSLILWIFSSSISVLLSRLIALLAPHRSVDELMSRTPLRLPKLLARIGV